MATTIELTHKEVALLIKRKVGELENAVDAMGHSPIRSKQEALPILARINELLALIPDPSDQKPLEVHF